MISILFWSCKQVGWFDDTWSLFSHLFWLANIVKDLRKKSTCYTAKVQFSFFYWSIAKHTHTQSLNTSDFMLCSHYNPHCSVPMFSGFWSDQISMSWHFMNQEWLLPDSSVNASVLWNGVNEYRAVRQRLLSAGSITITKGGYICVRVWEGNIGIRRGSWMMSDFSL